MNKDQADAIARAILEPSRSAQETAREAMDERSARLRQHRRQGGFALAGFAVGTVLGLVAFEQFAFFGLAGAAVGYVASVGYDRLTGRKRV